MTQSRSNLESEIALLVFRLRTDRMSLREEAVYYNRLRIEQPATGIESRLESLSQEIKHMRKSLR